MRKLLRSGFTRLWRCKTFYLGCLVMALFGVVMRNQYSWQAQQSPDSSVDTILFRATPMLCAVLAILCSLFIGTEHSDGVIRNKLVVGASRARVYLSNYIVCATAGLLMLPLYVVVAYLLGFRQMGPLRTPASVILTHLSLTVLMTLSLTAIFTLAAMLIENKTLVSLLCLVSVAAALYIAGRIQSALMEPELYTAVSMTAQGLSQAENVPNSRYIPAQTRPVYQAIMDILPTGQCLQIGDFQTPHPLRMAVAAFLTATGCTALGVWRFGRKDLMG